MTTRTEVSEVLDRLRGAMQVDGGDVELVSIDGDVVYVRMKGTCIDCPSAMLTLREGVERTLTHCIPSISRVVRVD